MKALHTKIKFWKNTILTIFKKILKAIVREAGGMILYLNGLIDKLLKEGHDCNPRTELL